jgi:hypothetical protein
LQILMPDKLQNAKMIALTFLLNLTAIIVRSRMRRKYQTSAF